MSCSVTSCQPLIDDEDDDDDGWMRRRVSDLYFFLLRQPPYVLLGLPLVNLTWSNLYKFRQNNNESSIKRTVVWDLE